MSAVARAIDFLMEEGRPIELAWVRERCAGGTRQEVLNTLATYQNPDGGFGRTLEPDIKAPVSNAFATRLAMIVLLSVEVPAESEIIQRLAEWLEQTQSAEGDWPFSPEVYEGELAPWFAEWSFPSLNPALCLGGLATRLGIGSERLHARVRALAEEKSSMAEIAEGQFYTLLPYLEYYPWVDHPARDEFLDALATSIAAAIERDGYDDAFHLFEHVNSGGPLIVARLPAPLIAAQLARLREEQAEDGGWPTQYDPAWRSWTTAVAEVTLRQLSG